MVALESTIFSNLGLPSPANREALDSVHGRGPRRRGGPGGDRGARRGRPGRAGRRGARVASSGRPQDGRARHPGGGRPAVGRSAPRRCRRRWPSPRPPASRCSPPAASAGSTAGRTHRRHLGRPRRLGPPPRRHGVRRGEGLPRPAASLEYLETVGVPVLGWQHDWFPAFYTRSSGLPVPHRVESADEVAAVFATSTRPSSGVLLAVPIPEADELDPEEFLDVLDRRCATVTPPASPARRSRRSCSAASPRPPRAAASRPTSPSPRTTPGRRRGRRRHRPPWSIPPPSDARTRHPGTWRIARCGAGPVRSVRVLWSAPPSSARRRSSGDGSQWRPPSVSLYAATLSAISAGRSSRPSTSDRRGRAASRSR